MVTHDRWFLDAVCTTTWEVHDGTVDGYDGGYAAYVLARAERDRQAAAADARRRNLVRKELAWLRRGPPARTSKPRFRLDAATALVADEPPPRDRLSLERFAARRLGRQVLELHDVDLVLGERRLLDRVTWRLGPGDRVGLVGVNGAGKTSLLRLLAGELQPTAGRVLRGRTVEPALLSQDESGLARRRPGARTRRVGRRACCGPWTATCPRPACSSATASPVTGSPLGCGTCPAASAGGCSCCSSCCGEPNVLLLDEPTNDLDIESLTVLEDHLDGWPGTLVLVSHDRYVLERVCDVVYALDGRGGCGCWCAASRSTSSSGPPSAPWRCRPDASRPRSVGAGRSRRRTAAPDAAAHRRARKTVARLDRQLARLGERTQALEARMAEPEVAADHASLTALAAQLREVAAERDRLEDEWLHAAERARN